MVFPRLNALHVLDTSARFDGGWSGRTVIRSRRLQNSTFKLMPVLPRVLLDAGHATHDLLIDAQASNRGNTVFRN